ncbi:MAG TPA: D-alanyl-D-alanine carboxypeptidase/D-alanyl-D-alanine-endopeptidase [Planctomycetota bacterium]|nr:D-alanyl-D-alanine carboxypeptidase/D-alanyl-D-alanine-endopeptidase [Planctomycetota bacterium]
MRACAPILLFLLALPISAQERDSRTFSDRLDAAVQSLKLKNAAIGVFVASARTGQAVYSWSERAPLLLASNTKVLTTSAALCRLGPDFKFRTSAGVLDGDLHVFGGGDPNISGRFHDDDPTAIFRDWAARIRAAGVTKANRLVLHTGIFDDTHLHPGWRNYDLWTWWAAPFGALSLNDNCVDLRVAPAGEGQPCRVSIVPDTSFVTIVNQTRSAAKSGRSTFAFARTAGTNTITLRGEVGGRGSSWVAVHDPTLYFGTVLKETLGSAGVVIAGEIEESAQLIEDARGYKELAFFESDLASTVSTCNQGSQNFYAEMIFRTLGWKMKGKGSTDASTQAVREFLTKEVGLEDFDQIDGSGLSRDNRMSAAEMVKLLLYMRRQPAWQAFIDSLPVNGDKRGTLKHRMLSPDLRNRIRAKTGHVGGVSSLSGYIDATNGDTYAFSIIVNAAGDQTKMGLADQMEDRICEVLARNTGE